MLIKAKSYQHSSFCHCPLFFLLLFIAFALFVSVSQRIHVLFPHFHQFLMRERESVPLYIFLLGYFCSQAIFLMFESVLLTSSVTQRHRKNDSFGLYPLFLASLLKSEGGPKWLRWEGRQFTLAHSQPSSVTPQCVLKRWSLESPEEWRAGGQGNKIKSWPLTSMVRRARSWLDHTANDFIDHPCVTQLLLKS